MHYFIESYLVVILLHFPFHRQIHNSPTVLTQLCVTQVHAHNQLSRAGVLYALTSPLQCSLRPHTRPVISKTFILPTAVTPKDLYSLRPQQSKGSKWGKPPHKPFHKMLIYNLTFFLSFFSFLPPSLPSFLPSDKNDGPRMMITLVLVLVLANCPIICVFQKIHHIVNQCRW